MPLRPKQRLALWFVLSLWLLAFARAATSDIEIAVAPKTGAQSDLAARELRRYIYQRCRILPQIHPQAASVPSSGVVLLRKESPLLPEALRAGTVSLTDEQYVLTTTGVNASRVDWIIGGGDIGVLYGAYRFAESLGVRFYLHGDVIPDTALAWQERPLLHETGKPLFLTRGLLPFHDFPEGPDWWTADDYALYVGQLPKMRMNFIGLHCYPEGGVGPEPLVWIGREKDQDSKGQPLASYPAFWFNTANDRWGFAPRKTSEFARGGGLLFESDFVGPSIMEDKLPRPSTPEEANRLFTATGDLLKGVVARAHALGIKVAVGTETPLTIPSEVARRLTTEGKDPKDPAVVQGLYEGMFKRIAKAYPVDYYWLWTPEIWTWHGNDPAQLSATLSDIQTALRALKNVGNPFTLATAGWVLGPRGNRTALDQLLPKSSPMSCISREVGHELVEEGFAEVQGRPKWSMPWIENDPNLTAPQPWVGRMRYDAADSLKLGCTGLMVNHWRTQIMAPNLSAVAQVAWDQTYAPADWDLRARRRFVHFADDKKILGGIETSSDVPVAGTNESFIYQKSREGLTGYDLALPNGKYDVTLRFNEPEATHLEERVFAVDLQGKTVESNLDIFARVGVNHALDVTYPEVSVTNETLAVRFRALQGKTCLSALTIAGTTQQGEPFIRKMRCGRIEPVLDYEGDREGDRPTPTARNRSMPTADFYLDYARANFGAEAASEIARLFEQMDGTTFPELGTWIHGPGGINARAIQSPIFELFKTMAALRPRVRGAGNLERFDYWLHTFQSFTAAAEVAALRARLDAIVGDGLHAPDATKAKEFGEKALTVREQMTRKWEEMIDLLLATVSTPGEMGTLVDLELHNRFKLEFLNVHDPRIRKLLGRDLPATVEPDKIYRGQPRLIIRSPRNSGPSDKTLRISVIVLDENQPKKVQIHWRPLGSKTFLSAAAEKTSNHHFQGELSKTNDDIEYYVEAVCSDDRTLLWPSTAPELNQTVIRFAHD